MEENVFWVFSVIVDDVGIYICVYENKNGEVSVLVLFFVDGIVLGKCKFIIWGVEWIELGWVGVRFKGGKIIELR